MVSMKHSSGIPQANIRINSLRILVFYKNSFEQYSDFTRANTFSLMDIEYKLQIYIYFFIGYNKSREVSGASKYSSSFSRRTKNATELPQYLRCSSYIF